MKFTCQKSEQPALNLSQAILNSVPPGGGLYVPVSFTLCPPYQKGISFVDYAAELLSRVTQDDPIHSHIETICTESFTFEPQLTSLGKHHLLELFHGPSLSFKDFGAQFLANTLTYVPSKRPRLVLVATSGDTGSAVAAAFYGKPNVKVVVLYPSEGVSERQAHQLSCWGGNITTYAVQGDFDACQSMVKAALRDPQIAAAYQATTANSINVGRLLPQAVYYSYMSAYYYRQYQRGINLVIPSGNLGNSTAACWAKAMGAPIDGVVIAQNDNQFVVDYRQTGSPTPKPSIATIANAMDVGNPSNFGRLVHLYPAQEQFCAELNAYTVTDSAIRDTIKKTYQAHNTIICPHTAVGVYGIQSVLDSRLHWVVAATAHPAKFECIVEPLINASIPVPTRLAKQLSQPRVDLVLSADFEQLKSQLMGYNQANDTLAH